MLGLSRARQGWGAQGWHFHCKIAGGLFITSCVIAVLEGAETRRSRRARRRKRSHELVMNPYLQFSLLTMVAVAAVTDLRGQRVPNWLTASGVVTALVLQSTFFGLAGLSSSLSGLCVGFALLIPFYAAGGMGAGDVKLMAAVGAFVGVKPVFWIFLITGLSGGVYALGLWILPQLSRVGAKETLRNAATGAKTVALTGQVSGIVPTGESAPKLCYAVCIAVAVIVLIAYGGVLGSGPISSVVV